MALHEALSFSDSRPDINSGATATLSFAPDLLEEGRALFTRQTGEADGSFPELKTDDLYNSLFSSPSDSLPSFEPNEVRVASINPDVTIDSLPLFERPRSATSDQPPEDRLHELLTNFPDNPTAEEYERAAQEVQAIFIEQNQLTNDAQGEFQNYGAIDDLLVESEGDYMAAANSLRPEQLNDPEFTNNLNTLHTLVFSGQTDKAKAAITSLMSTAGAESAPLIQKYFDHLQQTIKDNPEIIQEYRDLGKKYTEEWYTSEDMIQMLKSHPLGDAFFPMDPNK